MYIVLIVTRKLDSGSDGSIEIV